MSLHASQSTLEFSTQTSFNQGLRIMLKIQWPRCLIANFSFCSFSLVNESQKQVWLRSFCEELYIQKYIDHTSKRVLINFQGQFWASEIFTLLNEAICDYMPGNVWLYAFPLLMFIICVRRVPAFQLRLRQKPIGSHLAGRWEASQRVASALVCSLCCSGPRFLRHCLSQPLTLLPKAAAAKLTSLMSYSSSASSSTGTILPTTSLGKLSGKKLSGFNCGQIHKTYY